jgi:hypothetical protein
MSFRRAGSDPHEVSGVLDRSTRRYEGGEHIHLALRCRPSKGAAQVTFSHANRSTEASHSSRPSIGMS